MTKARNDPWRGAKTVGSRQRDDEVRGAELPALGPLRPRRQIGGAPLSCALLDPLLDPIDLCCCEPSLVGELAVPGSGSQGGITRLVGRRDRAGARENVFVVEQAEGRDASGRWQLPQCVQSSGAMSLLKVRAATCLAAAPAVTVAARSPIGQASEPRTMSLAATARDCLPGLRRAFSKSRIVHRAGTAAPA